MRTVVRSWLLDLWTRHGGVWSHRRGVVDDGRVEFYADGVQVAAFHDLLELDESEILDVMHDDPGVAPEMLTAKEVRRMFRHYAPPVSEYRQSSP
jgi:hypothetical protein